MKILVFADVHGSLSALEELKKTNDFQNADIKIFLGDVLIGCSRPNECIEFLKNNNCISILGNNDFYITKYIPKVDIKEFSQKKLEQMEYMKKILTTENKNEVLSWPMNYFLEVDNIKFHFTHYMLESCEGEICVADCPITQPTLKDRQKIYSSVDANYIIFGHEHKSNCFSDESKVYYCLGSLGLRSPGCYLIIEIKDGIVNINEKTITFDINHEIELMDKAGYPYEKHKIKRN